MHEVLSREAEMKNYLAFVAKRAMAGGFPEKPVETGELQRPGSEKINTICFLEKVGNQIGFARMMEGGNWELELV